MQQKILSTHAEAPANAVASGGYAYVTSLCDAIDSYGREAAPDAFEYRGVTLRFAVERALYFAGIDSVALRRLYGLLLSGEVPENYVFATAIEFDVARLLAASAVGRRWRVRRGFARVGSLARKAARMVVGRPLDGSQLSEVIVSSDAPVLVHAIHPKFVRYLLPLISRLRVPTAYLRTASVAPILDSLGLQSAQLAKIERSLRYGVPPGLAHHRSLVATYDAYLAALALHKPQCVVLAEGNAPQDEIMARACHASEIPIVCVQHGWSPVVHSGFRNLSYTEMLVWGDGFADELRPYNRSLKMTSVGNYALRDAQPVDGCPSPKGLAFFLQGKSVFITDDSWSEFLALIGTTAARFPGLTIRVREHSAYPLSLSERRRLEENPNVEVHAAADIPLRDVFAWSFASVSMFSSTILESIAAGVPPLVANFTSLPSYIPDVAAAGAGIEVKSAEAALTVLRNWILEPSALRAFEGPMDVFARRYFVAVGDVALANCLAAVARVSAPPPWSSS